MAYLPKSKYKKKYTNGNEFTIISTGELYVGHYLELPNNKFYAGNSPQTITKELETYSPTSTNIPKTLKNAIFSILNKPYVNKERTYIQPISTKTLPSLQDITNGSMIRYFGQRRQTGRYFEVDKITHDDIKKGNQIDTSIYRAGSIRWALKGNTEKINGENLLRVQYAYPKLVNLFFNLTEFVSP